MSAVQYSLIKTSQLAELLDLVKKSRLLESDVGTTSAPQIVSNTPIHSDDDTTTTAAAPLYDMIETPGGRVRKETPPPPSGVNNQQVFNASAAALLPSQYESILTQIPKVARRKSRVLLSYIWRKMKLDVDNRVIYQDEAEGPGTLLSEILYFLYYPQKILTGVGPLRPIDLPQFLVEYILPAKLPAGVLGRRGGEYAKASSLIISNDEEDSSEDELEESTTSSDGIFKKPKIPHKRMKPYRRKKPSDITNRWL